MSITTITPPAAEPLSVAEAKARLRVDHGDEDALIDDLIAAARSRVESVLGRALVTRRVRELRDGWADGGRLACHGSHFRLGLAPVSVVHHVKTYDAAEVATMFEAENYAADTASEPARLALIGGATWPTPDRPVAGIEIEYDAGYGDASAVPAPLREAVLQLVADMYETRTPAERATEVTLPLSVQGLMAPYAGPRL